MWIIYAIKLNVNGINNTHIISTIICGLFMPLTFNLMMTHIERKTVSPAVGFSMWWVYASVFLGALGMMVYYVVNVCKSIRRLRTL